MAIHQVVNAIGPGVLLGDGVSSSISIDLTNYLRVLNVLPNTPAGILSVSATSGVTVASSSLSGNILSVTFTSAPASGLNFGLSVSLYF